MTTDDTVRLFAWQPDGHGEHGFFVAANSEEEARKCVEKYIAEHLIRPGARGKTIDELLLPGASGKDDVPLGESEINGWGTDYYKLTVVEVGQVIVNENNCPFIK